MQVFFTILVTVSLAVAIIISHIARHNKKIDKTKKIQLLIATYLLIAVAIFLSVIAKKI